MATVSEVKFFPGDPGRCPECGREGVQLGRVNLVGFEGRPPCCIDCCFGPPKEFWSTCQSCGFWQPEGEACDRCGSRFDDPGR
jgi:hypothetical protein